MHTRVSLTGLKLINSIPFSQQTAHLFVKKVENNNSGFSFLY